jgi:transposase
MPSVQPSLPPAATADTTLTPSTIPDKDKPSWYLPPDSKIRVVAMQIIAMRIAGMDDPEIAEKLGISEKSISPYVYRASKNGWLTIDDPAQRLEYQLMHKVVQNIEEGLDDTARHMTSGMQVKTVVALKVAEGTLFKKFDNAIGQSPATTIVAVKIEMPDGPRPQIRAGNDVGGVPAHIDAEILHGASTSR